MEASKSKQNSLSVIRHVLLSLLLMVDLAGKAQSAHDDLLVKGDLEFLKELTRVVLDSSRIHPGQVVAPGFGANTTGGVLIRPGGRSSYPSFWIRDYAMSLPCGFIGPEEQRHMLLLTAATQSDRNWITDKGGMVPLGAIADHIRPDDGEPIYFPGTYDPVSQGDGRYGYFPPYCDQFYFIDMAYWYLRTSGRTSILDTLVKGRTILDRLEISFGVPPVRQGGQLVFTTEVHRGVDFGFRDVITMTGDLLMPSLLKYRAAMELAQICDMSYRPEKASHYRDIADRLAREIPSTFSDGRGMLRASTGRSGQSDVWGTSLAVYWGILSGESAKNAGRRLVSAYYKGLELSRNGNVRHVLRSDDHDPRSAWEKSLVKKDDYQNGAYWGTPVGWVSVAMADVDPAAARGLLDAYIKELREGDFRQGPGHGSPWECFNKDVHQNAVYLATVACPYIALSGLDRLLR